MHGSLRSRSLEISHASRGIESVKSGTTFDLLESSFQKTLYLGSDFADDSPDIVIKKLKGLTECLHSALPHILRGRISQLSNKLHLLIRAVVDAVSDDEFSQLIKTLSYGIQILGLEALSNNKVVAHLFVADIESQPQQLLCLIFQELVIQTRFLTQEWHQYSYFKI
jgi:hypothetical protein